MQNDWDSLFFTYRPHADQRPHDDHLLRDVGLARTALGEIALAEDPTHLVELNRPKSWFQRWQRAWRAWIAPAAAQSGDCRRNALLRG